MDKPYFLPDKYAMKKKIDRLEQQLAKANEREKRLEKILQRYESEQLQPLKLRVKELERAILSNCYDDPSTSGKRLMALVSEQLRKEQE